MPIVVRGLVTCGDQTPVRVELDVDARDRLVTGRMPCPACGTPCAPSFAHDFSQEAHGSLAWNGAHWADRAYGE